MRKILTVLGSIATLAVILIAMGVGKIAGRTAVNSYYDGKNEDVLVKVANDVNKNLPNMVDADTRLDNTVAGPGMRFTYQHTLVNYPVIGQNPFDVYDGLEKFSSNLTYKICNNAQMRPMIAKGVTVIYLYSDKAGGKVFDVVIPPSKCSF